jgi:putative addiction module component (TIGR02574 family)
MKRGWLHVLIASKKAVEVNMAVDVARTIDELCALPVDDRLKVVTAVWDSLPEESAAPVSPEQRVELNRRLDAYEANPEHLLTWDHVIGQLRGRRFV